MELYKVVKSEKVFKGKIIDVVHDTVILPNKKQTVMEVIDHPGAAAVVAIDKDKNIIMVRQYRHAIYRTTLEIPAGKLEKGEEPAQCAIRELEEETGYKVSNVSLLTTIYTTVGFCNEAIHIYLAKNLETGKANLDEDEFVTVEKFSIDEAVNMIMKGEIIDSKTIAGILILKNKL